MRLNGPKPRRRVIENDASPGAVGTIRAASVPKAPEIEKRRAGPQWNGDHSVWLGPRGEPMAAGNNARRSIRLVEVDKRPHHTQDDLRVGSWQRIDRVVRVERLGPLACADLDCGRRV